MMLLAGALLSCGGGAKPNPRDAADANDTGGTLPGRTASEQNILQQVAQLPPGSAKTIGDSVVIAEPAYYAASGRTCRALSITQGQRKQASHRLACTDGRAWFFVPDVLGLQTATE